MKEVLSSDNDRPFPHVYSPFGIPADKFERTDKRVKVIIDPTPGYFVFQMRSDLKKYDKTLLIHGCETPDLNNIREVLIKHGHKFTKVYSFDKEVLNNVKGSELFCFGSCWVADGKKVYKNHFDLNKKFKLSFIRSSKRELPGHKLRYEIEGLFNKQYPFEVFFPKERVESKNVLFTDSMFHLTIENSRYENYFTEKVIDCFMSYTIPIYWGCPNIAGYFDQNGIIQFNTKEELETILKNLSPEDYLLREKAVKKNYDIAKAKYAFFFERIDEYIAKL
ncbi:MAG TPA: glycosyltransferase family 10 [Bacteroidia bacterium]